jgi:hypothetical protein
MDPPTLQTVQDPILLMPWVYFRSNDAFPNPRVDLHGNGHAPVPPSTARCAAGSMLKNAVPLMDLPSRLSVSPKTPICLQMASAVGL